MFPPSHGRELFNFSTWKCAIWGILKKDYKQWIIPKEIWLSPQSVIRHPSNMNSKEIPPDLYTLNGHISFPA